MKVTAPGKNKTGYAVSHAIQGCFVFILLVFFSLKVNAQATCVGVIDGSRNEFCVASGSITFSNAVTSGENVQWLSSGDGTFNNAFLQNPTYTPGPNDITNGYVYIYLDVYKDDPVNFCSVLPVVTLHLGNMRTVATPASQTICYGSAISAIVLSGPVSSTTYTWTRDNTSIGGTTGTSGTGTIRGNILNTTANPLTVTFTITPTTPSCTGTPITATVLVNPRITATASTATQTICSGAAIAPIALSSTANNTTYTWTRDNAASVTGIAASGTGNITGTLTNTTASPVTVTFTVTPTANGCTGTAITSTVIVNPSANVVTTTPALQSTCSGAAITNIIPSGGVGGTTYSWTRNNTATVTGVAASGTGSIAGALTNTTSAPLYVTFTITPSTNACTNRASVLVNPVPAAVVTPSAQTICSGAAVTPLVASAAVSGTTYTWTRNNTASVTGIAASGSGNTIAGALTNTTASPVTVTFTITPTANGCAGTPVTATVLVNPGITGAVSAAPLTQTICSGATVTPIIGSGGGSGTTFSWTRDNNVAVTGIPVSGSDNVTGVLTNLTTSPVTVTFTITPTRNGCAGTPVTASVVVNGAVQAAAIPSVQSICSGTTISPVVFSGAASYSWTRDNSVAVTGIAASGSGSISGTLTNTTAAPVTVTFTIIPTTGACTGIPVTATVIVNPRPSAVLSGSQAVCSAGASPILSVAFNGTAPFAFTYTDGTTPVTVNAVSANPYTFTVPALSKTYTLTALNDAACTALPAGLSGTAVLSPASYTITASAGTNGSITPAGATVLACGNNQVYSITPNAGYTILDVLVDGVSQGAISSYTFSNLNASHSITASFSAVLYSITATSGADGSITPSGTISVGTGGSQTFSISASPCYQVADVLVDGVSQGAISTYTFSNVTASHTISVSCAPLIYPIVAAAGSNGTITPAGSTPVNCGSNQLYTITADAGFAIQDVIVDGISQGAIGTYTFNNVTASHTISAVFSAGVQIITAGAGTNGSITPSGAVSVANGSNQTFGISANSCYQVANVLVDGVSQGAINTFTFSNVTVPHSISATFSQLLYLITAGAGANGTISSAGATPVGCGNSQVYTITPDAGFAVQDVLVDGISQGAITTYTFTNVTAAHTISATFSAGGFSINATAGANGTITPAGSVGVASGGNQTFNIAANNCYQVADVLVDGVSQGAVSTYTFSNVTAPHSISVTFSQLTYVITASAGTNGTISTPGASSVGCGNSHSYTITPDAGFAVQDVLVDGVSQGAITSYTFSNVTAAHSISAVFVAGAHIITATAGINGTITPSGAVQVGNGSSQTFSIAASSCYQVADVVVDGVSQGAISSYTFTNVTAPHSISASFSAFTYIITASAGSNGSITPAGATPVNCGSNQTYSIAANAGFAIQDVIVDGISQGGITTYTFNNVTATHTISAVFSVASINITASAGANGTITPAGNVAVNSGSNQSFNIAAASCYRIADVLVDGVSAGAVSTYSFTNVTVPHTISASFTALTYAITASAGANGTITPAGVTNVNCGSNQTYTIAASVGFAVQSVIVDGVSQGAISSYTFTNVTAAHTISASFIAVSCTAPTLTTSQNNVSCFGSSTGLINLTTTGGTAPFTYSWTGPNGFASSLKNITGLAAGSYNVVVTANGGCTASRSVTIAQPAAALKATITAPVIVCNGTTTTLTVVGSGGAGTRQFSLNGGAYQTTTTFTVTASATPYIVTVKDGNNCFATSNSLVIAPAATAIPAVPSSIDGQAYGLCGGGNFMYGTPAVPTATSYYWTVPVSFTVAAGQGTNQIQLTIPPSFNTNNTGITVFAKNACGSSASYRLGLYSVLTYPGTAITGASSVNPGQTNVQYSLPNTVGATYNWLVPAGATVASGQGTSTVSVNFGTTSGNVSVDITNACGTGARVSKAVTFNASRPSSAGQNISAQKTVAAVNNVAVPAGFIIYPNPATAKAILSFNAAKAGGKYEVMITSAAGKNLLVKSGVTLAGINMLQIDLNGLSNGIYFVKLSGEGGVQTQRLVKQ